MRAKAGVKHYSMQCFLLVDSKSSDKTSWQVVSRISSVPSAPLTEKVSLEGTSREVGSRILLVLRC